MKSRRTHREHGNQANPAASRPERSARRARRRLNATGQPPQGTTADDSDSPALPPLDATSSADGIADQQSRRSHRPGAVVAAIAVVVLLAASLTGVVVTLGYAFVQQLQSDAARHAAVREAFTPLAAVVSMLLLALVVILSVVLRAAFAFQQSGALDPLHHSDRSMPLLHALKTVTELVRGVFSK